MWVTKREDLVVAKGKGTMQMHWLKIDAASRAPSVVEQSEGGAEGSGECQWGNNEACNIARLVDWNVEMLLQLLKQVMAGHKVACTTGASWKEPMKGNKGSKETVPSDEVAKIVMSPGFDSKKSQQNLATDFNLGDAAEPELHEFVP